MTPMASVGRGKRGVPEGLWIRCPQCKATVFRKEAETRFNVCPDCHHHFYVPARERIRQLLDEESFEEWFTNLWPLDPLEFKDRVVYAERLKAEQAKTGMPDAAVVGKGFIRGRPVVFGVTDFAFMAGSMGSVVGEKLTRAAEEATRLMLPLILVSGSGGGARMQEGILSLMQMAKVSAALARHDQAGGLYVSVLTNPTMGGVAASFALQGDITLAEPGALVGFAGKRTIWNTVRLELPGGVPNQRVLAQTRLCGSYRAEERFAYGVSPHHRLLRTSAVSILDSFKNLFAGKAKGEKLPITDVAKRFELLGKTGQGSMSKAWRAYDRRLGRTVCLKVLDKVKTARFEARFPGLKRPREGVICMELRHQYVVQTFEHGMTTEGEQYLVMELVDGLGLNTMIETGALPYRATEWRFWFSLRRPSPIFTKPATCIAISVRAMSW